MPRPSWTNAALLAAAAVTAFAAPHPAQAETIALKTLEVRWQTEIAGGAAPPSRDAMSIIAASDGRLSFGVPGALLVTIDASGKVLHRATPRTGTPEASRVAALAGGDFLVQADTSRPRRVIDYRRYAPAGTLRFRDVRLQRNDEYNPLHDAVELASGHVATVNSHGPGPNDVLVLALYDRAGRRVWTTRGHVMLGSEFYTRLYALSPEGKRQSFVLAANGLETDQHGARRLILQRFTFDGRSVMAAPPQNLGSEGEMRCSTVRADGAAVLGVVPSEAQSVIVQWFDAAAQPRGRHVFQGAEPCHLMTQDDGRTLVWLSPQNLVAFGPDNVPQWRAELAPDTVAVTWMRDGDIAAVHSTATGLRVARYKVP